MNKLTIQEHAKEFSKETHGSTDYGKDTYYIMGESEQDYVPLRYLIKKEDTIQGLDDLTNLGITYSSFDHSEQDIFKSWYEKQFQRKLLVKDRRNIRILYFPDHLEIFNSLEIIQQKYDILRKAHILLNGKNFPVQIGEWYAKAIFGLVQVKSSSQRGFDFEMSDKLVEVKVHWSDQASQKGVKIKRSALDLAENIILVYITTNFLIRDICFLDSSFIKRKFSGKGHAVFLKDIDIQSYFFSKSTKHLSKVSNKTALMKFASPTLAMKLAEELQ